MVFKSVVRANRLEDLNECIQHCKKYNIEYRIQVPKLKNSTAYYLLIESKSADIFRFWHLDFG